MDATKELAEGSASLHDLQLCLLCHLEAVNLDWSITPLPSWRGEGFMLTHGFTGMEIRVSKSTFGHVDLYSMTSGNKYLSGERSETVREAIRMILSTIWSEMKPK